MKTFSKDFQVACEQDETNIYENIDLNLQSKQFTLFQKASLKSKNFIRNTALIPCVKSQKSPRTSSLLKSKKICTYFEERNSFSSLKNSKLAKTIRKFFKTDASKLDQNQINKLIELMNSNSWNQLNLILNSPNLEMLKNWLTSQNCFSSMNVPTESGDNQPARVGLVGNKCSDSSPLNLDYQFSAETVKVAEKIKKFNQLINESNKSKNLSFKTETNTIKTPHIQVYRKCYDLNSFKNELNQKLKSGKTPNQQSFQLQMPSLSLISSKKYASNLHLTQAMPLLSKPTQSMPLIESSLCSESVSLEIKDSIELFKCRRQLEVQLNDMHRANSLSILNKVSANPSTSTSLFESFNERFTRSADNIDFEIMKSLCEIFKVLQIRYGEENIPADIEMMNKKQLLNEKQMLEQHLFKLDFEFGAYINLLRNPLYLRLEKRYKLIRFLLDGNEICNKCGRKTLI